MEVWIRVECAVGVAGVGARSRSFVEVENRRNGMRLGGYWMGRLEQVDGRSIGSLGFGRVEAWVGVVVVCFGIGIGRGGCMVAGWRKIGAGFEVEEGHFVRVDAERIGSVLPVQAPHGVEVHLGCSRCYMPSLNFSISLQAMPSKSRCLVCDVDEVLLRRIALDPPSA